ncbi:pyridoxamine 5'-phosphate oxidase family protein [Nocardioides nematodiphilus]|uniref:pyridoxamine 5'-phosphate oxidase family protein n=1 Tax=Nocardioides nematodiphilus TaxID=2849669 RepID=UPI001CD958C5|nr:pyridoxamine 5'-phosphate oxidase family protein [Nocardioides nematodiphilus]MCA1981872.1 pyridoxamine 5'-phosphate oxidase family protein [Nocardioides nematodiphilus]
MVDMSEDECWRLLQSCDVGRLAWVSAGRPVVVPVNFRVVNRQIVIRISPYSLQGREIEDSRIAFEADQIDSHQRTGWSVLLRGHAAFDYRRDTGVGPEPWPEGHRPLHVLLSPSSVTGRRLL